MYRSFLIFVSVWALSHAAPHFERRDEATASPLSITNINQVARVVLSTAPTATPASIPEALQVLNRIAGSYPAGANDSLSVRANELIANGFVQRSIIDLEALAYAGDEFAIPPASNPPPRTPIYPQASPGDAPYDISEARLRSAIRIPKTFTYGKKPAVILAPGTGSTGFLSFSGNFLKLLHNKPYADPVWLQIPDFLLDDIQSNAEYVAYAINYITSITGRNASVLAWSQGNIDAQWAFKYWPSTRSRISDLISISPDFHGSKIAYLICEPNILQKCAPAGIQQKYLSKFIRTLRADGGDSAYVETTTIYSSTDEIVQPQSGIFASAFLKDERGVGVTNNQVQRICPLQPAGGVVTHEGVLYNALAYALAVDALTHPGPGSVDRIDVERACSEVVAPGITLPDYLETESNIVIGLVAAQEYSPKRLFEPPIKDYALDFEE